MDVTKLCYGCDVSEIHKKLYFIKITIHEFSSLLIFFIHSLFFFMVRMTFAWNCHNLNCACVFCRLRLVRSASLSSLQKQVNVAACVLRALVWRAAVVRKTPSVSRVKMVSVFKTYVFNLNLNKI